MKKLLTSFIISSKCIWIHLQYLRCHITLHINCLINNALLLNILRILEKKDVWIEIAGCITRLVHPKSYMLNVLCCFLWHYSSLIFECKYWWILFLKQVSKFKCSTKEAWQQFILLVPLLTKLLVLGKSMEIETTVNNVIHILVHAVYLFLITWCLIFVLWIILYILEDDYCGINICHIDIVYCWRELLQNHLHVNLMESVLKNLFKFQNFFY